MTRKEQEQANIKYFLKSEIIGRSIVEIMDNQDEHYLDNNEFTSRETGLTVDLVKMYKGVIILGRDELNRLVDQYGRDSFLKLHFTV